MNKIKPSIMKTLEEGLTKYEKWFNFFHVKVLDNFNFLCWGHVRNKVIDHFEKKKNSLQPSFIFFRQMTPWHWTRQVCSQLDSCCNVAISKQQRKNATLATRMVCILFRTPAAAALASHYIINRMMSCSWAHTDASYSTTHHHADSSSHAYTPQ